MLVLFDASKMGRTSFALFAPLEAVDTIVTDAIGAEDWARLEENGIDVLTADYDARYAKELDKFRIERISRVATRFLVCGDYRQGVARIRCSNPECRLEYFQRSKAGTADTAPSGAPQHSESLI